MMPPPHVDIHYAAIMLHAFTTLRCIDASAAAYAEIRRYACHAIIAAMIITALDAAMPPLRQSFAIFLLSCDSRLMLRFDAGFFLRYAAA